MPSSTITYSASLPFMWVFLSKKQSKTTFTEEEENLAVAPSYLTLQVFHCIANGCC
jgi:hypothetical protein